MLAIVLYNSMTETCQCCGETFTKEKEIFKILMNELKWTYPIKVLKYKYIPLRVSMRMDQKFYKGRFDFDQYRWWKKEFREDQKISRKKF